MEDAEAEDTEKAFEITFRGNAEPAATELGNGLESEIGAELVTPATRVDRPDGAVLGAGLVLVTVVGTFILEEAAKELVKKGVNWICQKVESLWSKSAEPEVTIHLVFDGGAAGDVECILRPGDKTTEVEVKLGEWKTSVVTRLEPQGG